MVMEPAPPENPEAGQILQGFPCFLAFFLQ